MSNARLAVVIPHYQHEYCVEDAAQSVRDQTYRSIFLRLVSDNNPNMGKGFRMNKIVPSIEEEFLNVHDADDISCSDRFEICSKYFDDYDVIYHDIFVREGLWSNRVWERGFWSNRIRELDTTEIGENYIPFSSREWDRELYKKVSYIPASSIIVRTEIAKKVQWQTNTYGQDWIWLNLIAEHTDRFKYVPKPLLYYRGEKGFTKDLKFKRARRFLIRQKIRSLTK